MTTDHSTEAQAGREPGLLGAIAAARPSPVAPRTIERVLVTLDGVPSTDAAVRTADAIAAATGAAIEGIVVGEPALASPDVPFPLPDLSPPTSEPTSAERATAATEQVRRVLGDDARCPVSVRTGPAVAEIAQRARLWRADLIVTARGEHGQLEWLRAEERLLRLLRVAPCALLAVDDRLRSQPRRIVVGVDFSRFSLEVARLAVLVGTGTAAIYLVHVKPDPPFGIPHPGRWLKSYDDGVRAGLEKLRLDLALPASRVVETIVVHGHPGVALAEFAQLAQADLVATGVQGAGFFDRLVVGSVSSYLLRAARTSLLLVPAKSVAGVR